MFSNLFSKKYYKIECISETPRLASSKFGGVPYCKSLEEIPCDSEGKRMTLLAQINFDEIEDGLSLLPEQGILQFYISVKDGSYGADFSNLLNKNGFRVVYHEKIDYTISEDDVTSKGFSKSKEGSSPVISPCKIKFVLSSEKSESGSHILGSPLFCQEDPRPAKPEYSSKKYDTLLLQIDSCATDGHVEFGDQGIAHFFINRKALERKDFSDILYTWDCY